MKNSSPIGVLDSGIGGLTVWTEIVRLLPFESTVYYADSANCPYGSKSYEEITALTEKIVATLIDRGVKMIVVACNTITAAAISLLRAKYPDMLFVGMEPAIKPASQISKSGIIGILATEATLKGELYHKTADSLPQYIKIIETAGKGLVEMIESGLEDSRECESLTRGYIQPMIDQGADCIVLGCTHYPLLGNTINRISDGKLQIINPAPAVARRVQWLLEYNGLLNESNTSGLHTFLSSATISEDNKVGLVAKKLLETL